MAGVAITWNRAPRRPPVMRTRFEQRDRRVYGSLDDAAEHVTVGIKAGVLLDASNDAPTEPWASSAFLPYAAGHRQQHVSEWVGGVYAITFR